MTSQHSTFPCLPMDPIISAPDHPTDWELPRRHTAHNLHQRQNFKITVARSYYYCNSPLFLSSTKMNRLSNQAQAEISESFQIQKDFTKAELIS